MSFFVAASATRLDTFLQHQFEGARSRASIQSLIKKGCVTINERTATKSGHMLKTGDRVRIIEKEKNKQTTVPLDIVYENDDVLVINKPAGQLVYAANNEEPGTVVDSVLEHLKKDPRQATAFMSAHDESRERPGVVHRLDRETSGVLIVAKHRQALDYLKEQVMAHTARKLYLGIVWGEPRPEKGTIEAHLGRSRSSGKIIVSEGGREALTLYETISSFDAGLDSMSLLRLELVTGRTHQIRVHCASIGHAIVGDPLYGTKQDRERSKRYSRQLLHAYQLTIRLPNSREATFTVEPPNAFRELVATPRFANRSVSIH